MAFYFIKADGSTGLDFNIEKDNAATSNEDVHAMADDTFVTVAFHYDPNWRPRWRWCIQDLCQCAGGGFLSLLLTNAVDDEELTRFFFGIQNGEAVAKTMTIDYILASVER